MAELKTVSERKSNDVTKPVREINTTRNLSQQVINQFKAPNLLSDNKSVTLARNIVANKISEESLRRNPTQTEKVDKSKYNNVLRDYNKQASQNNCKGQCHGYEAGFEEEKEFNLRMEGVANSGEAGKGHALTYRETNWLWKFGNGNDIKVDGDVLKPLQVPGRIIASPFPRLDDLKVHGSISLNQKGEINKGLYDFNNQNVRWFDAVGHIRNYLNNQAIMEHGTGQQFMINYDYGNSGKAK